MTLDSIKQKISQFKFAQSNELFSGMQEIQPEVVTIPKSTPQFLPQGQTDIFGKTLKTVFPYAEKAPLYKAGKEILQGGTLAEAGKKFIEPEEVSPEQMKEMAMYSAGGMGSALENVIPSRDINIDNSTDKNSAFYQGNLKDSISSNETGIIPEEKKYSFSKYSGVPKLGKDLGKYQITEAELKENSKKYLGRLVSSKIFLKNSELQEKYMTNKIKDWISKGYTNEEIFAFHRGGQNVDINKPHIKEYINKAVTTFQQLNSKQ